MHIEIVHSLETFDKAVWQSLAARSSCGVFHSWEWFRAWICTYGEGDGLFFITAKDTSGLRAVLPLRRDRQGRRRVLKFIGDGRADYADILCAHDDLEARAKVLAFLSGMNVEFDDLYLNEIPEGSLTLGIIRRGISGLKSVFLESTPCPAMVFGKDKTLFDAFINKKSLKRHSRYFEEAGGLEVKHLTQAEDIYFWLNSFFDQHIQRWATRSDPSLFLHRDHRDFYRALLMEMGGTGRLLFTVVSSQGKPIAFHFGFIDDKKLIWYKPSFDPAFADRSPGEVLLRELAMFVRDQGLEELDFTRGGESFKTRFSNTVRRNASVVLTGSVKKAMLLQMRGQIRKSSFLRRFMECSRDAYASFLAVWTARQQVEQERQEFHKTQNAQEYYDSERIVSLYRLEGGLQKPEAAILELLRPSLSSMRMLDAGVGAGRTSLYFAPRVCSYAAFDYSPNMVRAAQELNGDYISPDAFSTGDMRHMSNRGPVDLLLISYNTIDCVSHEDRLLVLEEVKKTLSLGGWFVFSAHNIQSLTVFRGSGLGRLFKDFRRFLLLSAANSNVGTLALQPRAMVKDPAGHYQVPLYYISPMEQVRQLEAFGFKDVHVFSLETGKECPESSWADLKDSWLYYLCRRAENE